MNLFQFRTDKDIEVFNRIIEVMGKMGENEFSGKIDRLKTSEFAFLINENFKDLGFVYFVSENLAGLLFVDIGVLKKYRKKDVAYDAMKYLISEISCNINEFLVVEVEETNVSSLKLVSKLNGIKVSDKHYLLQPKRLNEFNDYIKENNINLSSHECKNHTQMMHYITDPEDYQKNYK